MTSPRDRDPKAELRRTLRRTRPDLESQLAQSAEIHRHLREWLAGHPARTIACYAALPGEPSLLELLADFPDRRWVLPRVNGETMHFHVTDPASLSAGSFGILEPPAGSPACPVGEIDLFLCPGMAFTTDGIRLGRGKGYYDRALEHANPESTKVGVCFREQVVPELPADAHDLPMQFLATPEGICSAKQSPDPADTRKSFIRSIGCLMGLLALASIAVEGFLFLVFLGNFSMKDPTHLLILLLGCLGPLLSLASLILLFARPYRKHLWLAVVAMACIVGFFRALSLPGARGIIH